ncbi:glycosyltransferase family 25 protein [Psychrobacter sp. 72-O-c]|uniref:glycosyltransferase family 25 protein n=1 Tax=Psychrobacter sp. 72-O-c TaxID=2774125 RepID=UPI00191B410F|nr:glycosyltransferase family 25 protein [Psychrobacter sp. 72-O-c]
MVIAELYYILWVWYNIGDRVKYVYYNNLHHSINKNALACADSHRRAQLIASNFETGYTLILEDDVVLTSNFKKKITNTIKLMQKHSLHVAFPGYNLAKGNLKKRLDINCSGLGFLFFKYPVDGHVSGAYAYIVDFVGARQLVKDNLEKVQNTADTFCIKEKGLNESTVVLYPKIVTTGYLESNIGYLTSKVTLATRVKQVTYSLSLKSRTVHYLLRHWKERRL